VSIRARRTPFKQRKLLVIDDDAKLLASYRDLLSPYGFEVLTAPDGQQAFRSSSRIRHPPVILDLAMPRMNGRRVAALVPHPQQRLAVIVISAYKIEDDAEFKPAPSWKSFPWRSCSTW